MNAFEKSLDMLVAIVILFLIPVLFYAGRSRALRSMSAGAVCENFLKRVDEMELSVRAYNCLVNENILYIADLVRKSENEMLKLTNFGRKSLNELKDNLKVMGLSFGMNLDGIDSELTKELSKKKSLNGNNVLEPIKTDSRKKN